MTDARASWRVKTFVYAAVIGCLTVALYLPARHGAFLWDDAGLLGTNHQSVDEWSDIGAGFRRPVLASIGVGYYRPLLTATYVFDYQYAGADPSRFHLTNVLLHGVNAALVMVLLLLFTGNHWSAAIGALLFAVHPMQVQAVALVLGRNDGLLVPPVAAMLIVDELCERRGRRMLQAILVGVFYAIALWTKETAVVAPVLLLAADLLWRGRPLRALRGRVPLMVVLAAITGVYFAVRFAVMGSLIGDSHYGSLGPLGRLALATATLGYSLRHIFVPWGFAPAPYHPGLVDPGGASFWIAALLVTTVLAATLVSIARTPRVAFGLLFFMLAMTPVLGLGALMKVPMLEHRTYLPMVGIAFAAAAAAGATNRSVGARAAVLAGLGLLAGLTAHRVPMYATALSLWDMGVANAPASDYARNNYASALMEAGRTPEAIEHLREALRLNPDYDRARYNLAACLEFVGRRPDAITELRYIIDRRPRDPAVLNRLGLMLGREGQLEPARDALERAVAIRPDDTVMLRNLADALAKLGRYEEASRAYRRVAELQPQNGDHWRRLGAALLNAGHPDQAVSAFQRTLEIGPESGRLQSDLASVLWRAGRWDEAASHARRARELGYTDPELWQQLQSTGALRE